MPEKKIKKAEVSPKASSWKRTLSQSPKPSSPKKSALKAASSPSRKPSKNSAFATRVISDQGVAPQQEDKNVPNWIVVVFIFSLVFFIFSLYKIFIYGQGYSSPEALDLSLPVSQNSESSLSDREIQTGEVSTLPESELRDGEMILEDTKLIQNFYSYLANNQIEEMNTLVDRPLKSSVTWANHWNKKNIKIFTKHLSNTVLLQDVFLIPNSINEEKKTRQYSYTLSYTIQPEHSFTENWQLTLITRGEKTLISEIMCKTEGCSRSPFFWPQNYGLK